MAITLSIITAGAAAWALGLANGLWSGIYGVATLSLNAGLGASIAIGAAGGFVGGLVTGGLRGGLLGALTGGIAGGIGYAFSDAGRFADLQFKELARATAHGVTGGTVSELAGGEFGSGFASSFAGSIAAHHLPNYDNAFFAATQAAVVGGGISELTGGSFENGAATAAFQTLFNAGIKHVGEGFQLWESVSADELKDLNELGAELRTKKFKDFKKMLKKIDTSKIDDIKFLDELTRSGVEQFTNASGKVISKVSGKDFIILPMKVSSYSVKDPLSWVAVDLQTAAPAIITHVVGTQTYAKGLQIMSDNASFATGAGARRFEYGRRIADNGRRLLTIAGRLTEGAL